MGQASLNLRTGRLSKLQVCERMCGVGEFSMHTDVCCYIDYMSAIAVDDPITESLEARTTNFWSWLHISMSIIIYWIFSKVVNIC